MSQVLLLVVGVLVFVGCSHLPHERQQVACASGPNVHGLALQLEIDECASSHYLPEPIFENLLSDGESTEVSYKTYEKSFRITLHNVDHVSKIITLGLNVNGEPSIDDDVYLMARNVTTGEVTETEAGAMSYWGSFERAYLPLPGGGNYAVLLRRGRGFVSDTSEDQSQATYEVWAEYRAGFVVYENNRGSRRLVTEIVPSNRLYLTRSTPPPSTVDMFGPDDDDGPTMEDRWPRDAR